MLRSCFSHLLEKSTKKLVFMVLYSAFSMNFKVDSFDEGDYLDLLLVFVKYNCLAYLSL